MRQRFLVSDLRAVIALAMQDGEEIVIFTGRFAFEPWDWEPTGAVPFPVAHNDEPLRIARFIGVPLRRMLFSDEPEGALDEDQEIISPFDE